jgi:hypothetical protein
MLLPVAAKMALHSAGAKGGSPGSPTPLDGTSRIGLAPSDAAWNLERELVQHLEKIWDLPDEGLWEVRGGRRQFTHSKVMAWVAFDRAVRSVEEFGLPGPAERWRRLREHIHQDGADTASTPSSLAPGEQLTGNEIDGDSSNAGSYPPDHAHDTASPDWSRETEASAVFARARPVGVRR